MLQDETQVTKSKVLFLEINMTGKRPYVWTGQSGTQKGLRKGSFSSWSSWKSWEGPWEAWCSGQCVHKRLLSQPMWRQPAVPVICSASLQLSAGKYIVYISPADTAWCEPNAPPRSWTVHMPMAASCVRGRTPSERFRGLWLFRRIFSSPLLFLPTFLLEEKKIY